MNLLDADINFANAAPPRLRNVKTDTASKPDRCRLQGPEMPFVWMRTNGTQKWGSRWAGGVTKKRLLRDVTVSLIPRSSSFYLITTFLPLMM